MTLSPVIRLHANDNVLIARTDLTLGQPLSTLSGGERQRVAIAKAMVQEPRLLILDEPTTYLDARYQLEVLDAVHRWGRDRGLAVLMVLHDLNLAAQYCDRLLLLKEGELVVEGKPSEVIRADLIQRVYGIEPVIIRHPESGVPQVLLRAEAHGAGPGSRAEQLSSDRTDQTTVRRLRPLRRRDLMTLRPPRVAMRAR